MLIFDPLYLEAANINTEYTGAVTATGGTEPYRYAIIGGSLPPGLSMSEKGIITGVPTELGVFNLVIQVSDSAPVVHTYHTSFQFTVLDLIALNNVTVDQGQFVQQFTANLADKNIWSTGLTTQTSQTLIELISALGTFLTGRMARTKEDVFSGTVQSDSAVRMIATMQGLRLSRKLPSTISVTLESKINQSISPYTQFTAGGYSWFNKEQIVLAPDLPTTVVLREGVVKRYSITGLGTDLQAWVSPEADFVVSDQDVQLSINDVLISKAYGGIWNYKGQSAYADLTMSDGRLLLQFGSKGYGTVPAVNDTILVTYVVTQGALINSANLLQGKVTVSADVTGVIESNPTGGADEKSPLAYKNFTAGTFGTYSSAVTKSQYNATINNYPGIVDCVTQAQREINPTALQWMNVIRVAGLTSSPWDQSQVREFIEYAESVSMYSSRFIWQTPVPIYRDIDVSVFCFNSVTSTSAVTAKVRAAIEKLFSARPGILMTNLYTSDIVETALKAAPGQISYVLVNNPTTPMIVAAPQSPIPKYSILEGNLAPNLYAYSISVDAPSPANDGTSDIGSPGNWVFPQIQGRRGGVKLDWSQVAVPNATAYHVWGRLAGHIGKIISLPGTVTSFSDDGSITPPVVPVNALSEILIRYNKINTLNVATYYSDRQSSATFPIRDSIS